MNAAVQDALEAEAYQRGRRDGRFGIAFALCPFADGTPEAEQWAEGWRSAQAEKLARYGDRAIVAAAYLAPIIVTLAGG